MKKKNKNIKVRTDVYSKKKFNQNELVRIDVKKDGTTTLDYNQTGNGRGIYFHISSLEIILKKKILENHIKRYGGNFVQIELELYKLFEENNKKQ